MRSLVSVFLFGWACGGSATVPSGVVGEETLFREAASESSVAVEDQNISLETIEVLQSSSQALIARPPQALHDEESILRTVLMNLDPVRECYQVHGENSTTEVLLYLEVQENGSVLGGSIVPAGGIEGTAAVSACILPLAKEWVFASRTTSGRTIVAVPLGFRAKD